MSRILLLSLAVLLLFSVHPSFAEGASFKDDIAEATIALSHSDRVSVSVDTIELPNNYPYTKSFMWGGDDATPPKKIIKNITISRNGQTIFIPLSAYSDLGDPREISLEKLSAYGFRLVIRGGDAGGAYNAMLDFRKNEISRRRVESGEFPQDAWEQTIFSFNHLNN